MPYSVALDVMPHSATSRATGDDINTNLRFRFHTSSGNICLKTTNFRVLGLQYLNYPKPANFFRVLGLQSNGRRLQIQI